MKLSSEFYRLPFRFDADRLSAEVLQFGESEWREHPQKHVGNTAIPLVTVNGGINDDMRGPMRPTPFLKRCPYLQQILEALGTVIGRARLMRIASESDATPHVDTSYYWAHHVRVHIPALTYPEVKFLCGDESIHMAAGEAWIFDTWKVHNVINPKSAPRIHFVADTVGSADFWKTLIPFEKRPKASLRKQPKLRFVPYAPGKTGLFPLETWNFPVVMTPWEQEALAAQMFGDLERVHTAEAQPLVERTRDLHRQWRGLWAEFGDSPEGWESFQAVLEEFNAHLEEWTNRLFLTNGLDLVEALRQAIVRSALSPDLAKSAPRAPAQTSNRAVVEPPPTAETHAPPLAAIRGPFDRPVFIVAAPRSGSTMLFELLERSPGFVTIGGESHALIEGIKKLKPSARDFESNRLTADDADAKTARTLRSRFLKELRKGENNQVAKDAPLRMLEKTPKNALRIPFLRAVFPGARFIYLYRDPEENISSMIEAWRSGGFATYPKLPGWSGLPWSLALISAWRELAGKDLAEVTTRQWTDINAQIISDLQALPPEDWCAVGYRDVLANPQAIAARLCAFAGVPWTEKISGALPHSRHTLTPPAPEKWRRNEMEMKPFLPSTEAVAQKARAILESHAPAMVVELAEAPDEVLEPTSVHTTNFPDLLSELGISILVSTYQAGKVIVLREQGGAFNTHFRCFSSPMGLAYDGDDWPSARNGKCGSL